MSDIDTGTGACLCGAVRFKTKKRDKHVGACHCRMCRRWGGGPLLAVECGADVSFQGADNISLFRSSDWAERGFCSQCGSHLFYRLVEGGQHFIPVGLFDRQGAFSFTHQVFIDKKPGYYDFANQTENMTEAEVFARYGAT